MLDAKGADITLPKGEVRGANYRVRNDQRDSRAHDQNNGAGALVLKELFEGFGEPSAGNFGDHLFSLTTDPFGPTAQTAFVPFAATALRSSEPIFFQVAPRSEEMSVPLVPTAISVLSSM